MTTFKNRHINNFDLIDSLLMIGVFMNVSQTIASQYLKDTKLIAENSKLAVGLISSVQNS